MSHRILSRRYRPQRFDQLFGQEHVVQMLGNALATGRVGQAYLFVGPRGVGKTTTARILARALNCAARVPAPAEGFEGGETPLLGTDAGEARGGADFEPCGVCASCRDIAAGSDLDVVEMDGASNNQVDDIRTLREQVGYATVRSRYRIWIVDEVHMLSTAAFNAFLKTLEEPPPRVKFFFCTTELHRLPETIVSRCTKVELRPIRADALVARLAWLASEEGLVLETGLAEAIAAAARGGLRDAESMLDQLIAASPGRELHLADLDWLCGRAPAADVAALFQAVEARDAAGALGAVERCLGAGAQPGVLLEQMLDHLRAALTHAARTGAPVARLAQSIDLVLAKRVHLRGGADGALVAELTAIELSRLPDARDLDALVAALNSRRDGTRERESASRGEDGSGASPEPGVPATSRRPPRTVEPPVEAAPRPAIDDVTAAVLDLDGIAERWPRFLEALAARDAHLAAALDGARPVALRGDVLELEFESGTASSSEARTALIRGSAQVAFGQVAPKVLGRRVRPVVRASVEAPVTHVVDASARELPVVRRVAEFTGGHVVHVERAPCDGEPA